MKLDSYKMPRPGSIVVWRSSPNADSCLAIVTAVGQQGLSCMLFPPDSKMGLPRDSVRHVDDPWNKLHGVSADSGVWDYTGDEKRLLALEAVVEGLKKSLAEHLNSPKSK